MGYTIKTGATSSISSGGQYDRDSTSTQNFPDQAAQSAAQAATAAAQAQAALAAMAPSSIIPQADTLAGSAGVSTNFARGDHTHLANLATATPLVDSGNGAVGIATKYAREDHAHPLANNIAANTGATQLASGTTAQRPAGSAGFARYNVTTTKFEGYTGSGWSSLGGGATGGGSDTIFNENSTTMTANYTITTGKNAMMVGPLNFGTFTLTIPTGSRLVIL